MHTPDPAMDQHHKDPGLQFLPATIAEAMMLATNIARVKPIYPHAGARHSTVSTIDKT